MDMGLGSAYAVRSQSILEGPAGRERAWQGNWRARTDEYERLQAFADGVEGRIVRTVTDMVAGQLVAHLQLATP
jgi:hypothetical protein